MADIEKHRQFVELRGRGMSYAKISEEIGISKTSLIRWSRDYKLQISNAKAIELERLSEKYMLGREHLLQVNGAQLGQITEELLNRDLSEVGSEKLFDMQRKLIKEIKEDSKDVEFSVNRSTTGYEAVQEAFHETETWKA